MLSLIAAVARNRAIGKDNQLLWHLPEDMKHFRETTRGKPVVMGRKTWESLPEKFRPLPGRQNIVVSRDPAYKAHGADLAGSLEGALALAGGAEEVFVIGGAQIYAQALPLADRFYLTRVFRAYEGDTHFPEWDEAQWRLLSSESFASGANYPYPFAFETYERRRN